MLENNSNRENVKKKKPAMYGIKNRGYSNTLNCTDEITLH